MESFLVDRSSRDGVRLVIHCDLNALLDIFKSSLAAHSLYNAVLEYGLIDIVEVDQVHDARTIVAVSSLFHYIDGKIRTYDTDRSLHHFLVADHDHVCRVIDFGKCQGFCYDLRTYACGIADRNCNYGFCVSHFLSSL